MKRSDYDVLLLDKAKTLIAEINLRDCRRVTFFVDARRVVRCTRVHYRSRGKKKRGTRRRPSPYRSEMVLTAGRPNFEECLHLASLLRRGVKPVGVLWAR